MLQTERRDVMKDDKDNSSKYLKSLIRRAGEEGAKKSLKIKTLEYKMDFGSIDAIVSMSLN